MEEGGWMEGRLDQKGDWIERTTEWDKRLVRFRLSELK
jgi:hypothetical protein